MSTYVIIGAGLAGAKTAEHLRELEGDARIVLLGGEQELPYERPELSKGYFTGTKGAADLLVHEGSWYADHEIDLRRNAWVDQIDVPGRTVTLADGTWITYDALCLATGSRPRTLVVPGTHREGVFTLRTVEDATGLRAAVAGRRLVVVGGGWIALEVAASARALGAEVTVLQRGPQVLTAVGPQVGARFAAVHRAHGVDLRTGVEIAAITGDGANGPVTGVALTDGTQVPGDVVLLAVGAEPRVELAAAAGLEIDTGTGGVLVDGALRTSAGDVVAVGDIAAQTRAGGVLRVDHWANALNQPAVAAATMVGDEAVYDRRPYLYSDQYDLGMEMRGTVPTDATVVIRGDDAAYLAFWLDGDGVPRAAMNVNRWDDGEAITALLDAECAVDPARLADPAVPLAEL